MQSNRSAVVAVLVSLSIAFIARTSGAQAPSDPCAQVTAAQVSTALGETVGAGKQGPPPTCTWIANAPIHQVVTLMLSPPGDWNTRKSRQIPGLAITPVSGVGDDAISVAASSFVTLYVKKGSATFMVRVYGVPDPTKQLAIEKPIAQTVAGHITG
jgi:hypothetical protein